MAREMQRILPNRNNTGLIDYGSLLDELAHFGVTTRADFRSLILRQRRALIEADRGPLDAVSERLYRKEFGEAHMNDRLRRQYWWSWEAMIRLALEFRFGDSYRAFVEKRDAAIEAN
jgi:hypothetical protein